MGLTDAQARMAASYKGFDFTDTWTIDPSGLVNGGYPFLQIQYLLQLGLNGVPEAPAP